jgi:hypothetical protein
MQMEQTGGLAGLGGISSSSWIDDLYRTHFGREADEGGRDFWLNSGLGQDAIAAQFAASPEAYNVNYIRNLYQDLLGREGDDAGINYWANSGLDEAGLYNAFVQTPEAQAQHFQMNYYDPIAQLYQTAFGTDGDAAGIDYWANQYQGDLGWEQIGHLFAAAPEAQTKYAGLDTPSIFSTVMQEMGYFPATFASDPLSNARVDGRLSSFDELPGLSDADKLRLARTLYGEGRGETDPDGLAAIMHVLRNRFATNTVGPQDGVPFMRRWGNTIDELTNEREFSTWLPGRPGSGHRSNYDAMMSFGPGHADWQRYMDLIDGVWSGAIPDPTGGAMSYYAPGTIAAPSWVQQLAPFGDITIGGHRFLGKTPLLGPGPVQPTLPGALTDPYLNSDTGYVPGPGSSLMPYTDPVTGMWVDPALQSVYGGLQPYQVGYDPNYSGITSSTMYTSSLGDAFLQPTSITSSGGFTPTGTPVSYLSDPGGQTGSWAVGGTESFGPYQPSDLSWEPYDYGTSGGTYGDSGAYW